MTTPQGAGVRALLLRHGQVADHRGDVPLTELGTAQAEASGRWFARQGISIAAILSGETKRTIDTATAFAAAYRGAGGVTGDPVVSFALRNPDLYLGGHRINMAEGAAALAAQSPAVAERDIAQARFFEALTKADDRVGFWLEHGNPPGDRACDVGARIDQFARSLVDVPAWRGQTVVAITHSPVLRAVRFHHWAEYSREPPFLHGYALRLQPDGSLELSAFHTDTGDLPATARPGPGVVRADSSESSMTQQPAKETL